MSIWGSHVAEEHSSAPPLLRHDDVKPYVFTVRLIICFAQSSSATSVGAPQIAECV